ncbi:helix-turn-helix transcriptional regulator [Eggerthellaceae bacterium zg-1084]|uniref:helix-turn-helix transcriptional regulator n=1 Tax=Berryella wangjianweii TaxID=2734634 RepID=UPI00155169BC|nr:helix-turn-helix transcriptional regulator [Berryella wangjianweii]NPD30504.1 helix-turn-helix transcriptional regulator [Berryella wangjianweii]
MNENKNCEPLSPKIIALALVASVGFGLLQGARLLDLGTGPYSSNLYALCGLVADGLAFIVIAALSYLGRLDRARPLFIIAVAASLLYAALSVSNISSPPMLIAMQITAGIGWALSVLCWMEVFTSYRPQISLPLIAVAYLINALLLPLTMALVPHGRDVVLIASFVLSNAALLWCLRNNRYVISCMHESAPPSTSLAEALARTKRAVANTCAFSMICGFIVEFDILNNLQYAQANLTGLLGIIAAAAMLGALLVFRPAKANLDYISPIAAFALATVLAVRSLDLVSDYAAGSLMTTFLISFYVLLWLMFISEAHERKLPSFFLLGLALGVARLSVASGRFTAQLLMERFDIEAHMVLTASIWLLVAALSLMLLRHLRSASRDRAGKATLRPDGMKGQPTACANEPPATEASATEGPAKAPAVEAPHTPAANARTTNTMLELKQAFRLTDRECEILGEFAAGRSARYLAESFVLSEHTIKTHLRRAYAKMGIHSRQELLDLMESVGNGAWT